MAGEFNRIRSEPTPPAAGAGRAGTRRGRGMPNARMRRKRLGLLLSGFVSAAVLLASGTAWAVTGWVSGQLTRSDVFGGLLEEERPEGGPRGALNVLVLGSDARDGTEEAARTDTMMLAHLNRDRDHITVVGLPRDSWVSVPGHGRHKINAAYALGGPSLAVQTVEANTGVRIDHYIEIDFTGFVEVVDAVGGIEVCLPEAIHDEKALLDMEAGVHHVDGTEALAFARTRRTVDGDLDRIDRQQQVLSALLDRAMSTGTLSDPGRFGAFLDSTLRSVTVDEGLDTGTIRKLGNQLTRIGLDDVTFTQVPVEQTDFWTPNDDVAVLWDRQEARDMFGRIARDEPLEEGERQEESAPEEVSPGEVTLRVYNGVGTPGLGAQTRGALMSAGFHSPDPAEDWPTREVPETLVRYAPGQENAAETVTSVLPGARTEADDSLNSTLEVVVGFNYEGVAPDAGEAEDPPGEGRDTLSTSSARDNVCEP